MCTRFLVPRKARKFARCDATGGPAQLFPLKIASRHMRMLNGFESVRFCSSGYARSLPPLSPLSILHWLGQTGKGLKGGTPIRSFGIPSVWQLRRGPVLTSNWNQVRVLYQNRASNCAYVYRLWPRQPEVSGSGAARRGSTKKSQAALAECPELNPANTSCRTPSCFKRRTSSSEPAGGYSFALS